MTHNSKFWCLYFCLSYTQTVCMLSVTGNLTIIFLTLVNSQLKSAVYFFLQNFSFLEISFTTICIPRFLYSMSTGDKTISYNACASQLLFVNIFGATIFSPGLHVLWQLCGHKLLHYVTIMSSKVFRRFVLSCWAGGLFITTLPN